MRKALSALGIAVSAAVPVAVPSSLEALMLVPCLRQVQEVERVPYPHYGVHLVKEGDTLWEISQRVYGTPWAYGAIASINKMSDPRKIKPGQFLKLYEGEPYFKVIDKYFLEDVCAEPEVSSGTIRPKIVYVDKR